MLSVVAWMVGQWWTVCCTLPFQMTSLSVGFLGQGWVVGHWLRDQPVEILGIRQRSELAESQPAFDAEGYDHLRERVQFGVFFGPGPFAFSHAMAVRHWLTITTFAMFYGALKWVYRKREVESCKR